MHLPQGAIERLFLFILTVVLIRCGGRTPLPTIIDPPMVRDGYLYAAPLIAAALLLGWLTRPAWAIIPCLLAFFFLWFFRDPERAVPQDAGAVVSPGDGKVTDVSTVTVGSEKQTRLSIFLNVFNVHVNRSPIAGVVRDVRYQRGQYLNAMNQASAELNEQNIVTVEGDGQRVGLIKFGSRVDVVLDASAHVNVKIGDHVKGGATVLAYLQPQGALTAAGSTSANERAH